jgi:GNAT superfamily N-acetyltransferase
MTMTPTIPATQVRRATSGELPALAHVLTRAFEDDPVAAWFFPDAARRREQLARFYGDLFLARMALGRDEIYTDDGLCGVASWTPPGLGHSSAIDTMRLLPRMAALWGRWLPRALRGLAYMESKFPETPHWHLPFLGVLPEGQGQGIGSSLMRPILERCDRDGTPAYLEASTARNRALYLRHGLDDADARRRPAPLAHVARAGRLRPLVSADAPTKQIGLKFSPPPPIPALPAAFLAGTMDDREHGCSLSSTSSPGPARGSRGPRHSGELVATLTRCGAAATVGA